MPNRHHASVNNPPREVNDTARGSRNDITHRPTDIDPAMPRRVGSLGRDKRLHNDVGGSQRPAPARGQGSRLGRVCGDNRERDAERERHNTHR